MFVKRFLIVSIAFVFPFFVNGQLVQSIKKNLSIETDLGYGFIMPHHTSIEYVLEDHITTFDIKLTRPTFGNKYWNQLYRYPYYGIGFYRSNLGNNEVFGHANALYTYVKVPFIGGSDKINISWQIAYGAAYITKYFDIEDNPANQAIGSHMNMYVDFSLQTTIPLSQRLSLTNGLRFTHISNGIVKAPNKGLNIFSGSLGLIYLLDANRPQKLETEIPEIELKNEYSIIYAGGVKAISRYEKGYYYASSLMLDYNRVYSLKGRWNMGVDIFFDGTNRQFSDDIDKADIINSDLYQIGLHLGHETVMGRLALIVNAGGYIYAPVEVLAPVYSRIGLRFRIKDKFVTNLTLKSHWAKATMLEWGIGYVIK